MQPSSDFIIPYAKQPGLTSFDSMAAVKKAIGTKKVGHTGTLDKFADGLLVLLSGKLTRLADTIVNGAKTYEVWAEFGLQTDTLDPEGRIIAKNELPDYSTLLKVLPLFKGALKQTPPEFSAIKIGGKRASDRMRDGEKITLKPRPIEILELDLTAVCSENGLFFKPSVLTEGVQTKLLAAKNSPMPPPFKVKQAKMTVVCSKGTYIRSLVRDIAQAAGSCASVAALRRTAIGGFKREDAAGFSLLPPFDAPAVFGSNSPACEKTVPPSLDTEILQKAAPFTQNAAQKAGIHTLFLKKAYAKNFRNGQKIRPEWFTDSNCRKTDAHNKKGGKIAVFCEDECAGLISCSQNGFTYETVF